MLALTWTGVANMAKCKKCLFKVEFCWITYDVDYLKLNSITMADAIETKKKKLLKF